MANKHGQNARLGAIGESYVQMRLMQKGWDAFNANSTYNNYKLVDIICLKPEDAKMWKPRTALIQVKTTKLKSFPLGFTIDECLNIDFLKEHVIGPWVFIAIDSENDISTFRCYVLTRNQVIELAHKAHYWYKNMWKREKDIKGNFGSCLKRRVAVWRNKEVRRYDTQTSCICKPTEGSTNKRSMGKHLD